MEKEKKICEHANSGNYKSVNTALQVFLVLVVTEHMMMVHPQGIFYTNPKLQGALFPLGVCQEVSRGQMLESPFIGTSH